MIPLTIELVPKSCWGLNVRTSVPTSVWDRLRRACYRKAGNRCEVCEAAGRMECHEVWQFNEARNIQRLTRLICLCHECHEVKHIGLAERNGRLANAKAHLAKVNGWTKAQVEQYLRQVWGDWHHRSQFQWRLDLDWLKTEA